MGENADSGVGIRALRGERVNGRPLNLQVQIHDDVGLPPGQGKPTGSLDWSNGGPLMKPAKPALLKPRGEWNAMELELNSQILRVTVNGQRCSEPTSTSSSRILVSWPACTGTRAGSASRDTPAKCVPQHPHQGAVPQPIPRRCGGHTSTVRGAVFTPDGQQLITASHDKTIRIWDANTGRPTRVLRPPIELGIYGEYFGVALSSDGKTLAVGGGSGRVFLIDLPSGRMLHFLVGHASNVFGLDFSPDGRYLATASADKTARIWDVATGQTVRTLMGHTGPVYAVRFSPDGSKVATGASDKTARIFSPDDGSLITTVTAEAEIRAWTGARMGRSSSRVTAVSPTRRPGDSSACGGWMGRCSNGSMPWAWSARCDRRRTGPSSTPGSRVPRWGRSILDLASGQTRATFDKSWNVLSCSALSPDGRLAATAGSDAGDVRIWRSADGQQVHQLRARGSGKWSAGWGADGTTIAWGNQRYRDRPPLFNDFGPRTHSFDLKTLQAGEPTGDFQIGSMTLDDLRIEKGGVTELLIKWGGEVVTKIDTNPLGGAWTSAAWVDRDRLIVGTAFGNVFLVDANTGKLKRQFIGHTGPIWAVSPSPDRRHFLTASQDSTLRVWSLDNSSAIWRARS